METKEFDRLRKRAAELCATQPARGKDRVSVDAAFVALAVSERAKMQDRVTDRDPEPWFLATLKKLKGSKRSITLDEFFIHAGKHPGTAREKRAAGRWLRDAGYVPVKTGGQLYFEF